MKQELMKPPTEAQPEAPTKTRKAYIIDGKVFFDQFSATDEWGSSCRLLYSSETCTHRIMEVSRLPEPLLVADHNIFDIPPVWLVITCTGKWQRGICLLDVVNHLVKREDSEEKEMTYRVYGTDGSIFPICTDFGGASYYTPKKLKDHTIIRAEISFRRPSKWKEIAKKLDYLSCSFDQWSDRKGLSFGEPDFKKALDFEDRWEWTIEGDEIPDLYINDKE